jgi:TPR repeat protein
MHPADANGNATAIGSWRVTEVSGDRVKATLERSFGGSPSVGLIAYFSSSRGPEFREGPDVGVPGTTSSGVPGKVTEIRGKNVTIRLDREAMPVVGDRVELSYSAGEDTISVGTWRVSGVRADGRVDAEPEEALGQPTPRMNALVFATGEKTTPEVPGKTNVASTPGKDPAAELYAEAMRIVEDDDVRAAQLFARAAKMGHPDAQNFYGSFLATGRGGVAVDDAQAVMWYRKAAAGGNAWAQANLCIRHVNGEGVEKDFQEALRLCRLAVAQNNSAAFDHLGWMHQYGLGVEKDLTQAVANYRRSAELGNANGQNNLAYMYEKGWGITQDYGQALSWYRKAAAQGIAHAEWNLGRLHLEGLGVPPNQATAIEHFRRAARAGHSASQEKLRQLGQSW